MADWTYTAGPRQTGKTEQTWPHYFSTYCMHDLHDNCRLTCKHCAKACRCDCHQEDELDRRSIEESEAADPAERIPWAQAKAQLGLE